MAGMEFRAGPLRLAETPPAPQKQWGALMHICGLDKALAAETAWCPTLGECWCGGLLCEHGCQRHPEHRQAEAAPKLEDETGRTGRTLVAVSRQAAP